MFIAVNIVLLTRAKTLSGEVMADELTLEHISKQYNDRPVIRDVSLKLKRGEIVGLFGPNGAGKTSTFSIVAGLIAPDSGLVKCGEHDITKLPMYKRADYGISYLPQESSIFSGLTVAENIRLALEMKHTSQNVIDKHLEELLGDFSITHLKHSQATSLSGGERRRVEIARALATSPKFILLDEPLAGIDPVAIADLKKLIKQLKSMKIGVLITDHNVRDTLTIVNRAYIMYDGKILAEGSPRKISSLPEVKSLYLGQSFVLQEDDIEDHEE